MVSAIQSGAKLLLTARSVKKSIEDSQIFVASMLGIKHASLATKHPFAEDLPTKHWGLRLGDKSDIRGVVRQSLETARKHFRVATGKEFNSNSLKAPEVETKNKLLCESSEHYFIHKILTEFLFDEDIKNILKASPETIGFVEKMESIEKSLCRAQILQSERHMAICHMEKITTKMNYKPQKTGLSPAYSENHDQFIDYAYKLESAQVELQKCMREIKEGLLAVNSLKNIKKYIKNFHSNASKIKWNKLCHILEKMNFQLTFSESCFEFYCVREALKNDPEFKYKLSTIIYRILFHPVAAYDFLLSMGHVGKTLLACLSTRSYFWNQYHSRNMLPDSAVIIFKLLGLQKEDLSIVLEKTVLLNDDGSSQPLIKMSVHGHLMFQEINSFKNKQGFQDLKDKILYSIYGIGRKEKGDKKGLAHAIWKELDKKWDNLTIQKYLTKKDVLRFNRRYSKGQRINFVESLSIFVEKKDESKKKENNFISYVNRFKNLYQRVISILGTVQDDSLLKQIKTVEEDLKNKKFRNLDIQSLEFTLIEYIENYRNLNFLDNQKNNQISKIEALLKNNFYFRCYDQTINQLTKMTGGLLNPNGPVRKILDDCKSKIFSLKSLFKNEILAFRENTHLQKIEKICSIHGAFELLIKCHNDFIEIERGYKNIKDDKNSHNTLESSLMSSYHKNFSKNNLSGSLMVKDFMSIVNKNFLDYIKEIIENKSYEEISKYMIVDISLKNGEKIIYSIDEMNKIIKSKNNYVLPDKDGSDFFKYLEYIVKNDIDTYEIKIDVDKDTRHKLKKIEELVKESSTLVNSSENMFSLSDIILVKQNMGIMKIINSIIDQFNLSGDVVESIRSLYIAFNKALEDNNEDEIKKLNEKLKENEILKKIIEKFNSLNTKKNNIEFDFENQDNSPYSATLVANLQYDLIFQGLSFEIFSESHWYSKSNIFELTKHIIERFTDTRTSQSVEEQLKDEIGFRAKVNKISESMIEVLENFSIYISRNESIFMKILERFNKISKILTSIKFDDNEISISFSNSISNNIHSISLFSERINTISSSLINEQKIIKQKLSYLCQHLESVSLLKEEENFIESSINDVVYDRLEDIICHSLHFSTHFLSIPGQKYIKKIKGACIIPFSDNQMYRNIFGNGDLFKRIFSNVYLKKNLDSFKIIEENWHQVIEIISQKPYFFNGYYVNIPLVCKNKINLLKKHLENSEYREFHSQDKRISRLLYDLKELENKIKNDIYRINNLKISNDSEEFVLSFVKEWILNTENILKNMEFIFDICVFNKNEINDIFSVLSRISSTKNYNTFIAQNTIALFKTTMPSRSSSHSNTEFDTYQDTCRNKILNLRQSLDSLDFGEEDKCSVSEIFTEKISYSNIIMHEFDKFFNDYNSSWNLLLDISATVTDERLKSMISYSCNLFSKNYHQIESDLNEAKDLIFFFREGSLLGKKIFSELILFRILKEINALDDYYSIQESLLDWKKNRIDKCFITDDEYISFNNLAYNFQLKLNNFFDSKKFKEVEKVGAFSKLVKKIKQSIFSSKKINAIQNQNGILNAEKLRLNVSNLMKYFEEIIHSDEALTKSFFKMKFCDLEVLSKRYNESINFICNLDKILFFIKNFNDEVLSSYFSFYGLKEFDFKSQIPKMYEKFLREIENSPEIIFSDDFNSLSVVQEFVNLFKKLKSCFFTGDFIQKSKLKLSNFLESTIVVNCNLSCIDFLQLYNVDRGFSTFYFGSKLLSSYKEKCLQNGIDFVDLCGAFDFSVPGDILEYSFKEFSTKIDNYEDLQKFANHFFDNNIQNKSISFVRFSYNSSFFDFNEMGEVVFYLKKLKFLYDNIIVSLNKSLSSLISFDLFSSLHEIEMEIISAFQAIFKTDLLNKYSSISDFNSSSVFQIFSEKIEDYFKNIHKLNENKFVIKIYFEYLNADNSIKEKFCLPLNNNVICKILSYSFLPQNVSVSLPK